MIVLNLVFKMLAQLLTHNPDTHTHTHTHRILLLKFQIVYFQKSFQKYIMYQTEILPELLFSSKREQHRLHYFSNITLEKHRQDTNIFRKIGY